MNGIRRLSQKHLLFGAHAVCLENGERTNCGRGCSFSVFLLSANKYRLQWEGRQGEYTAGMTLYTQQEWLWRQNLCLISPVLSRVYCGPALRAPPHPTLIQPVWLMKKKRACRGKQHTLIGIISKIEKIICSFFTVGGNFKMPRDSQRKRKSAALRVMRVTTENRGHLGWFCTPLI